MLEKFISLNEISSEDYYSPELVDNFDNYQTGFITKEERGSELFDHIQRAKNYITSLTPEDKLPVHLSFNEDGIYRVSSDKALVTAYVYLGRKQIPCLYNE